MIPKFRAWLKEKSELRDVVEIRFKEDKEIGFGHVVKAPYVVVEDWDDMFSLDDVVLMQSTGLKDKHGVEIFEGDIVNFNARSHYHPEVYAWEYESKGVGIIRYEMGSYILGGREESLILESLFGMLMNYEEIEIEVIGNIHEHSELKENVK